MIYFLIAIVIVAVVFAYLHYSHSKTAATIKADLKAVETKAKESFGEVEAEVKAIYQRIADALEHKDNSSVTVRDADRK